MEKEQIQSGLSDKDMIAINSFILDLQDIKEGKRSIDDLFTISRRMLRWSQGELDSLLESPKADLEEWIDRFIQDNPNATREDIEDLEWQDQCYQIADSATPIYYGDIDTWYYLEGNVFDEAYEDSGIYDTKPENYKQIAINIWIEQELNSYFYELLDQKFNS